jgi:ribA/ribD-fused uncharacterized protein
MKTDKYIFFWNGIYSQWTPSKFTIDGVTYNCCEQYMMAKKALLFNDVETYDKIMAADDPKIQKTLGRIVNGFVKEEWEAVCRDIVYEGNYAKFTQNAVMKSELLRTGDRELVEASPYDTIWGIGMHETDPNILDKSKWKGTNWLGEVIMKVRETIKKEQNG